MTELLSIGAFARLSRLSPKALRLYDELGLLRPVRVDPGSGYRRYSPDQLEQARLVAWLRRLDMPLARIRRICALDAAMASAEIRRFWAETEAAVAARRELAAVLVEYLSRKDVDMPNSKPVPPADGSATTWPSASAGERPEASGGPAAERLALRHAALSDRGLVRPGNQDAVHAGPTVLAVADGFGSAGAQAGEAAVNALRHFDASAAAPGELLGFLADAVARANRAVRDLNRTDDRREHDHQATQTQAQTPIGTTLTALLWTGSALALVHIGDSRAYLLRAGALRQITYDHTIVASMVEDGRLRPEEAATHPQRMLLLRALDGGSAAVPDIGLREVRRGDRYLLCSDGLSSAVPADALRQILVGAAEPERAVHELVDLATAAGGVDNISCVVADVVGAEGADDSG